MICFDSVTRLEYVREYARAYRRAGDAHTAALLYLAVHDVAQAVQTYAELHLFAEAVQLAKAFREAPPEAFDLQVLADISLAVAHSYSPYAIAPPLVLADVIALKVGWKHFKERQPWFPHYVCLKNDCVFLRFV